MVRQSRRECHEASLGRKREVLVESHSQTLFPGFVCTKHFLGVGNGDWE